MVVRHVVCPSVVVVLVLGALSCDTRMSRDVLVSGDASCVGAHVFVDGRDRGPMNTSEVVEKTLVADGLHAYWGDELPGDTVLVAGTLLYTKTVRLARGRHEIAIRSRSARALTIMLDVKDYNYVKASFGRGRVRAESQDD